jgi:hypothetical protein
LQERTTRPTVGSCMLHVCRLALLACGVARCLLMTPSEGLASTTGPAARCPAARLALNCGERADGVCVSGPPQHRSADLQNHMITQQNKELDDLAASVDHGYAQLARQQQQRWLMRVGFMLERSVRTTSSRWRCRVHVVCVGCMVWLVRCMVHCVCCV